MSRRATVEVIAMVETWVEGEPAGGERPGGRSRGVKVSIMVPT